MNEEGKLKKAVKSGNASELKTAFGNFYLRYWPLVVMSIASDVGLDDSIEDDAQEAFLKVYEKLPEIVGKGSLKRYLLVVAKRISVRRRAKSATSSTVEYDETWMGIDESGTAGEKLQQEKILALAKKTLTPDEYEVWVRRAGLGQTLRKIAKGKHISEDAAYRLYRKAIKKMKEALKHED
jgi:RNA polymerase sigma factor (sigma-70 family)